jgi:uncharacterized protein (DUF427 family)
VLETSHPPAYYLPPEDIRQGFLKKEAGHTFCEFKGQANYWSLEVGEKVSTGAAWGYENPNPRYAAIRNYLCFYASRVDECTVDGERVEAQAGDFYGGWITADVVGPFKGGPGTMGW